MATRIKPAMLSSRVLRKTLTDRGRDGAAFARTFLAIDQMSQLHDALEALHATPDPALTKESRALRYKQKFTQAMESSKRTALAAMESLNELERQVVREAEERAGLHKHVDSATQQEIRAALRALPQAERDAAIRAAAMAGDAAVIAAVRNAPSALLTGVVTAPMEELVSLLIHKATPDLDDQLESISVAAMALDGAVAAFTKEAEALRDPILEARADEQARAARAAEASIDAAGAITSPTE